MMLVTLFALGILQVRDSLSSFLPTLPGIIDTPAHLTNSSLRSLIEKPPVFKEFTLLNQHQVCEFYHDIYSCVYLFLCIYRAAITLKGEPRKGTPGFEETTLSSLSVPCLFVGEYTEKGLPRSLTPSLLWPFTNHRDYSSRILVVPPQGYICIHYNF